MTVKTRSFSLKTDKSFGRNQERNKALSYDMWESLFYINFFYTQGKFCFITPLLLQIPSCTSVMTVLTWPPYLLTLVIKGQTLAIIAGGIVHVGTRLTVLSVHVGWTLDWKESISELIIISGVYILGNIWLVWLSFELLMVLLYHTCM